MWKRNFAVHSKIGEWAKDKFYCLHATVPIQIRLVWPLLLETSLGKQICKQALSSCIEQAKQGGPWNSLHVQKDPFWGNKVYQIDSLKTETKSKQISCESENELIVS